MSGSGGFYKWILEQVERDDVVGDIAIDVRRDERFPKDVATKKEFLNYIRSKTGDADVLTAAEIAYDEYKGIA